MDEKRENGFWPDWKLVVAIVALLVAIFVALYGAGQCQQPAHPAWITPFLNLVCTTSTTVSSMSPTSSLAPVLPSSPSSPNSNPAVLPLPGGKLVFTQDFEDGFSHGFNFNTGSWKVIDDGTGNRVLDQDSQNGDGVIGPPTIPDFSDGTIEFRFRTISGAMQLSFRLISTNEGYTSYPLLYESGGFQLHYQKNGNWQPIEGFSINGSDRLFKNKWITVRIEAFGKDLKVFADGNLVISAYDSRISAGRIDFGGSGHTQFDNFEIWDSSQ